MINVCGFTHPRLLNRFFSVSKHARMHCARVKAQRHTVSVNVLTVTLWK